METEEMPFTVDCTGLTCAMCTPTAVTVLVVQYTVCAITQLVQLHSLFSNSLCFFANCLPKALDGGVQSAKSDSW